MKETYDYHWFPFIVVGGVAVDMVIFIRDVYVDKDRWIDRQTAIDIDINMLLPSVV